MKNTIFFIAACAAMAGCAVPMNQPIQTYHINAQFDKEQATRLIQDGTNTIKGNAFMRQRGGGVVTCAGKTVYLVPATDYAKERIFALYGPGDSGMNNSRRPVFDPDVPEYVTTVRTSKCDSQGNFQFERIADGEFFIYTSVLWSVGYSEQGGNLMHRITVKNNQLASVVLSS